MLLMIVKKNAGRRKEASPVFSDIFSEIIMEIITDTITDTIRI